MREIHVTLRWMALALLLGVPLLAEDLEFEVASVRGPIHAPMGNMKGGPGTSDPERMSFTHVPMSGLIGMAFENKFQELIAPDWVRAPLADAEVYDVEAKVPPGATREQASEMMRNLLKSRFHLAYHFDTKVVDGFELVIGKGGPKLTPAAAPEGPAPDAASGAPVPRDADGYPVLPAGRPGFRSAALDGRMLTTFRSEPVSVLTRLLSPYLIYLQSAHIVDHTGLTGKYDFKLDFMRTSRANELDDQRQSIIAALQKLGLDLKAAKVPVDTLVIDHLDETPTGN